MLTFMPDSDERWEPLESLGPTGATVARNVKRLRKAKGLAYTDLSARLAALNRTIPTLGLRKIESGGRRVDVDDLVALAAALNVSPISLLIGNRADPEQPATDPAAAVAVTGYLPDGLVRGDVLWNWLTAQHTLPQSPELVAALGPVPRMRFVCTRVADVDFKSKRVGPSTGSTPY